MYLLIVPRSSSDTVIAAKQDALSPSISAKSTDKKGDNSKFSMFRNETCCRFCSLLRKMKAITGANLNWKKPYDA